MVSKKTIGIYSITNIINGKIYIGQSIEIEKRWRRHKNELKNNKHDNIYLQRSVNKYGFDNFQFEIIEECKKELLNEREIYWISNYNSNSFIKGYNSESGGSLGKTLSDATKKKIGNRYYPKGEDNANSSLTNLQVVKIKKLLSEKNLDFSQIGHMFNVKGYIVGNIKDKRSYKNVETEYDDMIEENYPKKFLNINPKKLNDKEIIQIKQLLIAKEKPIYEIADYFSVAKDVVSAIKNIRSYKSVGKEYNELLSEDIKIRVVNKQIVMEIKYLLYEGILNSREIGEAFGISIGLVQDIKKGRAWKTVITEWDDIIKNKVSEHSKDQHSKIPINDIVKIKTLLFENKLTQVEIAKLFNIGRDVILSINTLEYNADISPELNETLKSQNRREKLTEIDVIKIKQMIQDGLKNKEIVKSFNIDPSTISNIRTGKIWKHIQIKNNIPA